MEAHKDFSKHVDKYFEKTIFNYKVSKPIRSQNYPVQKDAWLTHGPLLDSASHGSRKTRTQAASLVFGPVLH